jgi:3-hydroxybutyryl-CoA dehydrogenase
VYIDLLFENDATRIMSLSKLLPKPVVINSVIHTSHETHPSFVRINGWPGFLKRDVAEFAGNREMEAAVSALASSLNKKAEWVEDITGMFTPKVIAMIVNEAYFAFGEDVSTKVEIDTAMKLGTNYPQGPFEWSKEIGLENIHKLLLTLSANDKRYQIAPALIREAVEA